MYAAGAFICVQYDEDKAEIKDFLKQEKVKLWDFHQLPLSLLLF